MLFQLYVLVRHGLTTIWIQVALLRKEYAWKGTAEIIDEPVEKLATVDVIFNM